MSAGFDFRGETVWGTNGAVEVYLEALRDQTAARYGEGDPLAVYFREEREGFFTGKVVFLDVALTTPDDCARFVGLLDAATARLQRQDAFSDYGWQWVRVAMVGLEERVAAVAGVAERPLAARLRPAGA